MHPQSIKQVASRARNPQGIHCGILHGYCTLHGCHTYAIINHHQPSSEKAQPFSTSTSFLPRKVKKGELLFHPVSGALCLLPFWLGSVRRAVVILGPGDGGCASPGLLCVGQEEQGSAPHRKRPLQDGCVKLGQPVLRLMYKKKNVGDRKSHGEASSGSGQGGMGRAWPGVPVVSMGLLRTTE